MWRIGGQSRRDRRDIAARDLYRGVGQADSQQAVALVDPHFRVERLTRIDERDAVGPRPDDPFGGLDVLNSDRVDAGRDDPTGRHVDRQLVSRLRPSQPHGERLVADEDGVGQQDRPGIDPIVDRGLPVALLQGVGGGAVGEGALEAEGNAPLRTFDGEPSGVPLGIVDGLEGPCVHGDGHRHLAARLQEPAVVRPHHPHAFEACWRRADEDVEEGLASGRIGRWLSPADDRRGGEGGEEK